LDGSHLRLRAVNSLAGSPPAGRAAPYGLTLLAIRLLGSALDAYARHQHLYAPKEEGEELHSAQRKFLPVVIGYVMRCAGLILEGRRT
jgi:hypothetical protein